MLDILGEDDFELTPGEDQHPVEALPTDRADEALGAGIGPWGSNRVRMVRIRSERKTSSEPEVKLASRSRTKNRMWRVLSASTMVRLRAYWTTHAPVGLAVTRGPGSCFRSAKFHASTYERGP